MISDVTLVDVRARQVFDEVAFQATLRCHSDADRRVIVSAVEHAGEASGFKFSGWEKKNVCMYNRVQNGCLIHRRPLPHLSALYAKGDSCFRSVYSLHIPHKI